MKAKIRLTVDVTFEANGTTIADLKNVLYQIGCSLEPNEELVYGTSEVGKVRVEVEYLP
jgi:hypothetical protein